MERLHMNYLRDVIHRLRCGESQRRIARDTGLSRPTIQKYGALAEQEGFLDPHTPLPDDATLLAFLGAPSRPPQTPSSVEPYAETVNELLDQHVEMTAILDRLRDHYGYTGSYSSLRRYVRRIRPREPDVVVRVHTLPGEEAQVDFGPVGKLFDPASGRLRTAYAFVATLCYSRHQYAELVFSQKVPTWIACHRHAFESWGGVPGRIVPDNLKAAVLQVLVDDLTLGEPYRRMAQHYGFMISPTRPGTPRHKGKVEAVEYNRPVSIMCSATLWPGSSSLICGPPMSAWPPGCGKRQAPAITAPPISHRSSSSPSRRPRPCYPCRQIPSPCARSSRSKCISIAT